MDQTPKNNHEQEKLSPSISQAPTRIQDFGGITFSDSGKQQILQPQDDITIIELTHICTMTFACIMNQAPSNAFDYIQRHKLERHFTYAHEEPHGEASNPGGTD